MFISIVSGPSGCVHGLQNQSFLTLDPLNYPQQIKQTNNHSNILELQRAENLERQRQNNPADPSYKLLKIFNMKSISIKEHEMAFANFQYWIWDSPLSNTCEGH